MLINQQHCFTIEDLPYEIFDHIFYYLLPSPESRKVTGFNDLLAISHTNRALRERMKNNSFFWSSVFARFSVFVSTYFVDDFPLVYECEKEFSNCSGSSSSEGEVENGKYYYSLLKEITKEYIDWLKSFCDLSLIRKLEIPVPVDDSPDEIMKMWSDNTYMLSTLLLYSLDGGGDSNSSNSNSSLLRMESFLEKSKLSFSHLHYLDIFDGFVDPGSILTSGAGRNLRKISFDLPKESTSSTTTPSLSSSSNHANFIKNFVVQCRQLPHLQSIEFCSEHFSLANDEIYEALLSIAPKIKQIGLDCTDLKSLENWNQLAPHLSLLKRLFLQTSYSIQLVDNGFTFRRYRDEYQILVVPPSISELTITDNVNVGSFFEEVTFSVCFNGLQLPKLKKIDLQISCVVTENQKPFPNLTCFYYDTFGSVLMDIKKLFNFWMNSHDQLRTVLFSSLPSESQPLKKKQEQQATAISYELVLLKKPNQMKAVNLRSDSELVIEDCPIQTTIYNISKTVTVRGINVKKLGLHFNEILNEETSVFVDIEGSCEELEIDYSKSSRTLIHLSGRVNSLELIASRLDKFEHCSNLHLDESTKASIRFVSIPSLFLQQESEYTVGVCNKFYQFLSQLSNLENLKIVVHEDYEYNIDTRLQPLSVDSLLDIFSKKFNLVSTISSSVYTQRVLNLQSFATLQYLYLKGPHKFKLIPIPNLKVLELSRCNIEGSEVDLNPMKQLETVKLSDLSFVTVILDEPMDRLKHFLVYSIKELKSQVSIRARRLRSFVVTKIGKLARHSVIEFVEVPKIVLKVVQLPDESTPTSPIPATTFEGGDDAEESHED